MTVKRIETHYDETLEMYVAVAPAQNFCTGFGKTPEEAWARLELAISLWFDSEDRPLCGPECAGGEGAG